MILISVVIPTYNGEKHIEELVVSIAQQLRNVQKEVIIIDSESNDSTWPIVSRLTGKYPFLRLYRIKKRNFNHGLTRNLGVRLARGRFVAFLSQDVGLKNKNSFSYFIKDFDLGRNVVAAFSKDIPRPKTPLIQKLELLCRYEHFDRYLSKNKTLYQSLSDPFCPLNKGSEYLWYALSNVFSCYRRSFLLKNPFSKTDYGEDLIMGRKIIKQGLAKVYDARCAVLHSHNLSLIEYYQRQKDDLKLRLFHLNLEDKPKPWCKIQKILRMKDGFLNKIINLARLFFYYLLKLVIIIELRLFN